MELAADNERMQADMKIRLEAMKESLAKETAAVEGAAEATLEAPTEDAAALGTPVE